MGKIKQGILGGFNGTTGSVVGASWKGIAYMRGKAQSIKNPRTSAQQNNRTLFGIISDIMSKSKFAIDFGYKMSAVKKSPFNVAVQKNVKAQQSFAPVFNYTVLQFSDGNLTRLVAGSVAHSNDTITVTCNAVQSSSGERFIVGVVVYDGKFPGAPFVSCLNGRIASGQTECSITFPEPQGITYSSVHAYVFEFNQLIGDASLTTYVGSYTPE